MKNLIFTVLSVFCGFAVTGCQTTDMPAPKTEVIYFNNDSADVSPMGVQKICQFVKAHQKAGHHDGYMMYITGYTNAVGRDSYNQTLSERRALAVGKVAESCGVANWRITGTGYGEKYPMADNNTNHGKRVNRRVVIGFEPADPDKK